MDRREAILRELNVYPLWTRRGMPAVAEPEISTQASPQLDTVTPSPAVMTEEPSLESATPGGACKPSIDVANLSWSELKQQVRGCTACGLREGCTQTVFGVGDENADWLFIGEAPGAEEDARDEPFVGEAGRLLDNMLVAIKLKRNQNVYIANVLKCQPPDDRKPAAREIALCLPYLQRQIALIQPKVIVALGKTAATALLGKESTIASLRGTLHDYNDIPLIVTYHPAYLLRSPSDKAKAWQDLCLAVSIYAQTG